MKITLWYWLHSRISLRLTIQRRHFI